MIGAAPSPVAPFSHAVESGNWVFLTGQMPTDPDDDTAPLPEGVSAQTHRVMDNLAVARVFLTHFDRDYAEMNEVYRSYFAPDRLPARTCVGVTGLAVNALVEIEMIARRP